MTAGRSRIRQFVRSAAATALGTTRWWWLGLQHLLIYHSWVSPAYSSHKEPTCSVTVYDMIHYDFSHSSINIMLYNSMRWCCAKVKNISVRKSEKLLLRHDVVIRTGFRLVGLLWVQYVTTSSAVVTCCNLQLTTKILHVDHYLHRCLLYFIFNFEWCSTLV